MPTKNPLPPKEAALFRRVVRCYEMKQYKNGIKFANQILSKPKFTDHGETLAMKGLILMCMGRRDDALDLVRRGLRCDLQSHVCWHVYGLVQRAMHRYDEAIKAYRNALKWEKDNVQILRDLSLLQVQMRDLEGYKDTRYQLLVLRPAQKVSWVGYAVALHLLGDFNTALRVLEEFKKTLDVRELDFEYSELLLYMGSITAEAGRITDSLDFLSRNESNICDIVNLMELKGNLLLKIPGRTAEAKRVYENLLERNPENRLYADRLAQIVTGSSVLTAKNAQPNTVQNPVATEAFLNDLLARYPKSPGLHFVALSALPASSPVFLKLVTQFIRDGVEKGIPPLFVSLRPLYSDIQKRNIIEKIITEFVDELSNSGHFTKNDTGAAEPPTSLIWASFYLAQHHDYIGNSTNALTVLNRAIAIVPTLPDLLLGMARICKHAGHMGAAAAWADEAQSLDTADRYLNYKCARYMLRCGRMDDAELLLSKFTKPSGNDGSAAAALSEMQCMWFLLETAAAYRRQAKIGEALKKCHEIERHFSQMFEDQFDFHTYCPRKMTLSSYIKLVRLTDSQHKHRFFIKAAQLAVGMYCDLADDAQFAERNPESSGADGDKEGADGMNERERKKLKSKQRKQQAKQQAETGANAAAASQDSSATTDAVGQVSSSFSSLGLDGNTPLDLEQLAHPANPLEIANNYARPLIEAAPELLDTQMLAFEVYWRRGVILRMVSAVRCASRLSSLDDPQVHFCVVRMLRWLEEKGSGMSELVSRVVKQQLSSLFGSGTIPKADAYNREWLQRLGGVSSTKASLEQVIAYARALFHFDQTATGQEAAVSAILARLDAAIKDPTARLSLKTCTNLYSALSSGRRSGAGWCLGITLIGSDKLEALRSRLHSLLPYSTAFMTRDEASTMYSKLAPPESKQEGASIGNNSGTSAPQSCDVAAAATNSTSAQPQLIEAA